MNLVVLLLTLALLSLLCSSQAGSTPDGAGNVTATSYGTGSAGPFASLATCTSGNRGTLTVVADSTTVTWGATISGGGSSFVLAFCDGSNWTVAAK